MKKLIFIFGLLISFLSFGQTTLLSPTGDGGFETGTTLAANGWTVANDGGNFWVVGTGTPQYAGSRGAYIASTGTTYAYTKTAARVSHMYRDLVIPSGASAITLTFYWKGKGESGYDRLLIYTTTTSVTPVAASPASPTNTITGETLIWTQPTYTVTTYTLATVTIPDALAGTTVRLHFMWQNDGSLGTSPGAAVDNIGVVYTPLPSCSGTPNTGTVSASTNNTCSATATTLTGNSLSTGTGISYQWQSSSNNSTWADVGGATGSTYATTLPSGSMYYRIKTTCSNSGISSYSSSIQLIGTTCVICPSNSTTITNTGCSGTVYDPGGTGNYNNSQTGTITLYPSVGTDKVRLTFSSFSTESGYDGLVIYDGNNTSAPIISSGLAAGTSATNCPAGSYYGTTSPSTVTSTAADGSLTLVFRSDGSTVSTGFEATISCFTPPAPGCSSSPSPSNGVTGITVAPTLTWAAVQYATEYDVYIGETLPGTPTATVSTNSYTPSTLSPLTSYQWKVVPKNASGLATGCSTWSFTTMSPAYATAWISMNTGSSNWCAGETRNVTVTVKNNGANDWSDNLNDFNIGVKWNGDADYNIRVDAQGLFPGETQTYTFSVTAPNIAGSNNLTFDVVLEGCFWFGTNGSGCGSVAGPGNIVYVSPTITINDYPTSPNAVSDVSICLGKTTQLSASAVGPAGTAHTASENSDYTQFTTSDATRWSISSTTNAAGTTPELRFAYVSTLTSQFWAKSPQVNATSYSTLSLSFKHYCDWYTSNFILRLQTSTDGTTWTDRWTTTVTADIAATTQTVNLNVLAGTNFYYRFMYDGNTWNVNNWYIDNISITGNKAVTYSWSPSDGLSSPSIYNPIASPNQTTTYTMTASLNGCSVTDQVVVTVDRPSVSTVNSLIGTGLVNGDYLWNGNTSTSWNLSSNWYQYVSNTNSFELTNQNPTSISKVYIFSSSSLGSCVGNGPTLDVTDNIEGLEVGNGVSVNFNNTLNVSGDINIQGTLTGNGTIILNGTGDQTISGNNLILPNLQINKISGNVILDSPTKISGTLTMTQGNIYTTSTNILEIGTNTTTLGSISWTSGSILGPIKRWFGTSTNSTQASGILPLGGNIPSKGVINRYAQVNFTQSTSGGYLIGEYILGTPSTGYNGLPLTYNANQYVQNFEEEGYWSITPYSSAGVAYGSMNTEGYTLKLRMNNPSTLIPGQPPVGENGNIITDVSKLRIISSKGPDHTSWVLAGTQGSNQSVLSSGDYLLEETGVTGFSFFNGGGNDNNPLPVELTQFEANPYSQWNIIKWTTASEYNSSYFNLESSFDGENWRLINTKSAAGNSTEEIRYSYIDYNLSELTYYRLEQFDIDGKSKIYGPILVTKTIKDKKVIKYINLMGQEVNPENTTGLIIEIYDDGTMKKMIR